MVHAVTRVLAEPVHLYGLNYNTRKGPDFAWDKCKWKEEIITDLMIIKRITNRIRILSLTDCGQGEQVLEIARDLGLQVWLGMWVGQDEWVFENEKGALADLISKGLINYETVLGITVGSEAFYREDATLDEIIDNKNQVRNILNNNGFSQMPVSIVEIAPNYFKHSSLRSAVDVIYTNIFPFWEAISIDDALADLKVKIDRVMQFPESQNKEFILGETGWPSDGFIEGVGIASPENQVKHFTDFYCKMDKELNWKYYWFTAIDNAWRQEQDPDNTIEGTWGFMKSDLTLKPHFQNLSFTCSNGVEYSFGEIDWTIPTVTAAPATVPAESCQAHSACAHIFGNCCPTDDGWRLSCCDALPTDPPVSTPMPTPSPTKFVPPTTASPTRSPTRAPSKAPITGSPTIAPVTPSPTVSPVTSTPTASPVTPTLLPTKSPTKSPTSTPSVTPTDSSQSSSGTPATPADTPNAPNVPPSWPSAPSNTPVDWPSAPSAFNEANSNASGSLGSSIFPSFLFLMGTIFLIGFAR